MPNRYLTICLPFLVLPCFWPAGATAQSLTSGLDSSAVYRNQPKSHFLNNGRSYQQTEPRAEGHPFLGLGIWEAGSVVWLGQTSAPVLLKYDIEQDRAVYLTDTLGGIPIVHDPSLVGSFFIGDQHFVFRDPFPGGKSGYYQEVYRDSSQTLWFRYEKYVQTQSRQNSLDWSYVVRTKIFLEKGPTVLPIGSKGAFLKAAGPLRKEAQAYMRQEHIRMRKVAPSQLKQVLSYLATYSAS